jgi:hypothetical protein
LVDIFRDSIIAVQTKLKEASRVAIDEIFDDGYTKLSQFGWIRKLWHVMIEFDPVELDKHANEVEQVGEVVCEHAIIYI